MQGKREAIPDDCPTVVKNLITRCWDGEPTKRPKLAEMIALLKADSPSRAGSGASNTVASASASVGGSYEGNMASQANSHSSGNYQNNLASEKTKKGFF